MSSLQPGTTDRMVDQWIEPAFEAEPKCRACDHELSIHDSNGCNGPWDDQHCCPCKEFV